MTAGANSAASAALLLACGATDEEIRGLIERRYELGNPMLPDDPYECIVGARKLIGRYRDLVKEGPTS